MDQETDMVPGQTVWSWIKKYWQILAGFLIAFATMFAFRRKPDTQEIIENQTEAHKKEIKIIKDSEEILKNKVTDAEYIYEKTLKQIEKRHLEEEKELSETLRSEVKHIIETHKEEPAELTRRISKLTGFEIYVEEDD
jgi:flagellar biosynthesis/type III secretory pathway M-ring protein FliF/YscJ